MRKCSLCVPPLPFSRHPPFTPASEVGRVADRNGSKRIERDVADNKTEANSAKLWGAGKEGPIKKSEYKCSATMASTVAARLVAAKHLDEDEVMRIPMRSRQRVKLAPEALADQTAGRAATKRISAKLGPIFGPTTCLKEFASLF